MTFTTDKKLHAFKGDTISILLSNCNIENPSKWLLQLINCWINLHAFKRHSSTILHPNCNIDKLVKKKCPAWWLVTFDVTMWLKRCIVLLIMPMGNITLHWSIIHSILLSTLVVYWFLLFIIFLFNYRGIVLIQGLCILVTRHCCNGCFVIAM